MLNFWIKIVIPIVMGAVCQSVFQLGRRAIQRGGTISPLQLLVAWYSCNVVLFCGFYVSVWGLTWPRVLPGFLAAVVGSAILNVFIQYCGAKAASLDAGEVSLTAPLFAMTPGLIALLAISLGELPGLYGWFGVGFMAVGSYTLMFKDPPERWYGWFLPFQRLRFLWDLLRQGLSDKDRNRAKVVVLALAGAFLGTFGLMFDGLISRRSVDFQGVAMGGLLHSGIMLAVYLPAHLATAPTASQNGFSGRRNQALLLLIAIAWVGHFLLVWPQFNATFVAYVGTLKRFNILIGVVLGHLLLGEGEFSKRLWAAGLIFAGATLISRDGVSIRVATRFVK